MTNPSSEHTCHWCGTTEGPMRPYGPGGSRVCYPCGTSPEHEPETLANFFAQFDAALAMGGGGVIIGGPDGPEPFPIEES